MYRCAPPDYQFRAWSWIRNAQKLHLARAPVSRFDLFRLLLRCDLRGCRLGRSPSGWWSTFVAFFPSHAARPCRPDHSAPPEPTAHLFGPRVSRSMTALVMGGKLRTQHIFSGFPPPCWTHTRSFKDAEKLKLRQIGRKDFAERSGNVVESGSNARVSKDRSTPLNSRF